MKKIFFIFVVFFILLQLVAHEFWLQPNKFQYKIGDTATIHFYVGENFNCEIWGKPLSKLKTLTHYTVNGKEDIAGSISGNTVDSFKYFLNTEGTHVFTFNSNNSFIELKAKKFNAYLLEDGHYNTIKYRVSHNETNAPGKENYQRSVKTLVQCGAKTDNACSGQTNLPLDIIPNKNPYGDWKKPPMITFRVLFVHQPLQNALVNIWHKKNGKLTVKKINTDKNGEITTIIEPKGNWMVSCVNMVPNTADSVAQWQSYWGSVTFGYNK